MAFNQLTDWPALREAKRTWTTITSAISVHYSQSVILAQISRNYRIKMGLCWIGTVVNNNLKISFAERRSRERLQQLNTREMPITGFLYNEKRKKTLKTKMPA